MLLPTPLRVCMLSGYRPTPGGGGTEKHICELALGLQSRGVMVEIICEDRAFLPDEANPLRDQIIGIPPGSLRAEGWIEQYREKSLRYAEALDPNRYDLIHCHSHYGFHTALKLAGLRRRPALVTTYHLTPLGSLRRFAELGVPEPEGAPIDRAVAIMEESMAQLSDRCIAVSEGVAEEVIGLYGVSPDRVQTIYNWYDPRVFVPTPRQAARQMLGWKPEGRYLLYVGHFGHERGQLMAEALRRLPEDVTLVAVNPEADEEIAAEFGERVLFPGYLKPAQMAIYYSAADLQCFPTFYGAFGLVLVEGMACGCPAVAFDYSAMNEIVTPSSGYLVREPRAEAYAATILRALADGGSKRPRAAAGASAFRMEPQIDQVLNLYRSVLAVEPAELEGVAVAAGPHLVTEQRRAAAGVRSGAS